MLKTKIEVPAMLLKCLYNEMNVIR